MKDALPTDQPIQSIVEAGWNWGKCHGSLKMSPSWTKQG